MTRPGRSARCSPRRRPRAAGCACRTCATSGDPLGLDGSADPHRPGDGRGRSGQSAAGSASANERRMLAYGLRDSVRLAIRPGTNDVWVTDRGGGYWEEFNARAGARHIGAELRLPVLRGRRSTQNGNPYTRIRPASDAMNLNICENLYRAGNATVAPYWAYDHELPVVPARHARRTRPGRRPEACSRECRSIRCTGASFPAAISRCAVLLRSGLRDCIYALLPGSDGLPQRGKVVLFAAGAMRTDGHRGASGRRHAVRRSGSIRWSSGSRTRAAGEPCSDGGRDVEHHLRRRAAERRVRRERIERSRTSRCAHLRVGPGRRRRVRRLDRREAEPSPTRRRAPTR